MAKGKRQRSKIERRKTEGAAQKEKIETLLFYFCLLVFAFAF
jgi:hypothetical protein